MKRLSLHSWKAARSGGLGGVAKTINGVWGAVCRGISGVIVELARFPRWLRAFLIGVLLIFLAVIVFLAQPNWDWFRPALTSILSKQTHREVRIEGPLRVYLFRLNPRATVAGLKIGAPDWAAEGRNLAQVEGLTVETEWPALLVGHLVLTRLEIDRPDVYLFQEKEGRANWDFSNGAPKGKPMKLPPIKTFIITDGKLAFTSLQRRLTFAGTINAHEKTASGRQAFGLTGEGSLNGKIFQMKASGAPLLNVRSNTPYPFDMSVRAGNTEIIAHGRVVRPFDLGRLDGKLSLKGGNLADLYYLTGLTLPNTPAYRISANVMRNGQNYDIAGIDGRVGSSDLKGAMKVDISRKGRPYLSGDLRSDRLDFEDLGALFGASRANAPKAPELKLDPQATRSVRHLLPDAPLSVERVRGMDAKVRYRALAVKAMPNLPLRQVSLGVDLDHGLLTLKDIDFSFPRGRLQGTLSMNARASVQTNTADLRLTGLSVQDLVPKIGGAAPLEGVLNARLKASGTGNSVHDAAGNATGDLTLVMPGGTIRQSFAELMGVNASKGLFMLLTKDPHETDVRCAIAHFEIRDGLTQARNIVFDTGVVRVTGSGVLNLKDESLKLVFKGKPKKFRLIKVNVPLVVGGHLSAPAFGVDPGPAIVQTGLAAAFSSVLPFAGLGMAENADCAALMAQAKAEGAPVTTRPQPYKRVPHKAASAPAR